MAEQGEPRFPAHRDLPDARDSFRGWNPFRDRAGGRLERALEEPLRRGVASGGLPPAMDIAEHDDGCVVTAEIPGAAKEDVVVEAQEGVLTLRGVKRCERRGKKEQSRWVERRYASFSRSFTLPANTDTDRVRAGFQDGALTVGIAEAEDKRPEVIAIA